MIILENPNPVIEETHVCSKCQCKFAFNKGDIHVDSYHNGVCGPGSYGYLKKYIYCPNCGEIHYLYDSTVASDKFLEDMMM